MTSAFPSSLAEVVDKLSPLLLYGDGHQAGDLFSFRYLDETLSIPGRVYCATPPDSAFFALSAMERTIVACWFTRHHDGYIRERFLRTLPSFNSAWVIGYVVALCGEHVIEILDYIWERRDLFDRAELAKFLQSNTTFYALTRSRIISYWNCYYRSVRFDSYVGSRLLSFLDESISVHKLI